MTVENTLWVERYRPSVLEGYVGNDVVRAKLEEYITNQDIPHLLFYGTAGTGKTTAAKILVKNIDCDYMFINASDERGIDIIRSQINQFVNSKTLFNQGMKFVILDEVDYMTKNAQQALRYLLQNYSSSVRFCLICNYISRIDEGLQNEFLRLRFNQLPENDIITFLGNISEQENLNLTEKPLRLIQKLYKSDIRSMINFMQSNQNIKEEDIKIIDDSVWNNLYQKILNKEQLKSLESFINDISSKYNIDKKNIIKDFLNYIIRIYDKIITPKFLYFIENIMHFEDCKNTYFVNYSLLKLSNFIKDS